MNSRTRRLPALGISITLALSLVGLMGLQAPSLAAKKPSANAKPAANAAAQSTTAKTKTAAQAKATLSPETQKAINEAAAQLDPATRASFNKLSEAVHLEDQAIRNELQDDQETAVSDVGMLWQAAVERSGTIRYAIEKLSRRDATGKAVEGDSFTKRIVQNMVQLGGVAGSMWSGTPTGVLGAGMLNNMIQGNPQQDPALSRVTDADMVILAKEVESLQSQLMDLYYNYRHAKERLSLAQEASSNIGKYYDHASNLKDGTAETLQPLMQSIYDASRQDVSNAEQALTSARTSLGLVVGADAIAALEQTSKSGTNQTSEALPSNSL